MKQKKPPNKLLTIDTGENTGLAYWQGDLYPDVCEITVTNKKANHETKLCDLWKKFHSYILTNLRYNKVDILEVDLCIMEIPELWGDDLLSLAATKRGNLFYLSLIIGGYARICHEFEIPFTFVTAREWKGQHSKRVTASWLKNINGITYKSDHISDAVGIGFWYFGWKNAMQIKS